MGKIVAIDLFCGAGGLTRGLLDAGIDVVAGFDIDRASKKTYEYNNNVPYINKDICSLEVEELKSYLKGHGDKLFLLAGCAPCQPFSTRSGKRVKKDDRRIGMLKEFTRLIKEGKPDLVFMENVPGIVSREPQIFNEFIAMLLEEEFIFDKAVVDAKNFKVPQNRKRLVLFASKKKITVPCPANSYDDVLTVKKTISWLPPLKPGGENKFIPNHKCIDISELNLRRLRQTPHDGGGRLDWNDPELTPKCHRNTKGFKNSYGRLKWNEPAPTVTTRFYTYSSGRHGHPEQDRALSLKEGALLQSFPDNYVFFGTVTEIGKQIGNAVPPRMAYWFGRHLIKHVKN